MDKKNKHIEQLTPELIQAYHSGKLTSSEMHRVELLMLESPLYSEGIEGLESLSNEEFDLDIESLSTRIDRITEDQKPGFWTTWKKAAAVILVLITASGLFYLNQPPDLPTKELSALKKPSEKVTGDSLSNDLQANEEIETEPSSPSKKVDPQVIKPTIVVPEKELITDQEKAPLEKPLRTKSEAIEALPAPRSLTIAKLGVDKKRDSLVIQPPELKSGDKRESIQALISAESSKRKLETDPLRSSLVAESKTSDLVTTSVKGTVTGSDDGLPLPQVTILQKGTVNGTQTNRNGEFNFESLQPNTTLVIRYLGYVTQEVEVGNKREINIKLSPDATSLGEVVVTGVAAATPAKKLPFSTTTIEGGAIDGSRAKTNVGSTQSSSKAKPVNGFAKFRRYLKKSLRYPEAAKPLKIRGQVTVEFRLSSTGELFDFRIIKGLGSGCDEEAIRLIREGPKWNPKTIGADKTPVLSIVTVKVRFRP